MPDDRRLTALCDTPGAQQLVSGVARAMAGFHAGARVLGDEEARVVASSAALTARWARDLGALRRLLGDPDRSAVEGHDDPRRDDGKESPDSLLDVIDVIEVNAWRYLAGRRSLLTERIGTGMIRDGHGDLLADDIFCLDDGPRILDCLAFSDHLRCADVLADVAFLIADLQRLGHHRLARCLLRAYCEFSGEHHPGSLAHLYVAHRAVVRAKVVALRNQQLGASDDSIGGLLRLAVDHLDRATTRVVLVGGLPGSGKSTTADALAARYGWTLLSSDEIRRDLGLRRADLHDSSAYDAPTVGIVYREMRRRAHDLLDHGLSVILDASWTRDHERQQARALARETMSELTELRCFAPEALCRARVAAPGPRYYSEAAPDVVQILSEQTDPWPEAFVVDTDGHRPNQVADSAFGRASLGLW